jgi:hypothetical protein
VRDIEGVAAYQVVRGGDGLTLNLLCDGGLAEPSEALIRSRLRRVHPLLGGMRIRCVDRLEQTAAGKTPVVIGEPGPSRSA